MTPADIHDLLTAVSTTKALLPERVRELQSMLIKLSLPPLQFRPLLSGGWLTDAGPWDCESAGATVLHLVAHNPGRWLELREGVSLRAWRMAITRARDSLIATDPKLAAVLAPAATENGPGVRLRETDGRVHVRWRPPPGRAVAVGVPLPCP
jgi:hypothetical protein